MLLDNGEVLFIDSYVCLSLFKCLAVIRLTEDYHPEEEEFQNSLECFFFFSLCFVYMVV